MTTLDCPVGAAPTERADPDRVLDPGAHVGEARELVGIPPVGAVVAGKYRVDAVVGLGGMGIVLAVTNTALGERYAMKCLLPRGASDPESIARFRREAQASARIKSEHVARVIDYGDLDSGAPYLLMEYLSGRDLGAILQRVGRLPIRDAVDYVLQACAGVAEAHAIGIVHRDLKPSNLFLTQRLDGAAVVKVLDFGISKAMDHDLAPTSATLTQTTSVFGSPAYMSPEQLRSTKKVDYRADVWGLGVILYELLAGTTPFRAETGSGLLAAIAADPPDSLRAHRPDVSEELEAVVMRCLEKDVKRRWQCVSDLALALEPFSGERSLASIGRIVRLSGPPAPPIPGLEPQADVPSSSSELPAFGSSTFGPITTAPRASSTKSGRTRALLAFAGFAALLGGGVAVSLRVPSMSTAPSGRHAMSRPTSVLVSPSPSAGTSVYPRAADAPAPASPQAASPQAASPATTSAATAPATSARSSGAKQRRIAATAAPAHANNGGGRVSSATTPPAAIAPAPIVTAATASDRPRDPTEDSH